VLIEMFTLFVASAVAIAVKQSKLVDLQKPAAVGANPQAPTFPGESGFADLHCCARVNYCYHSAILCAGDVLDPLLSNRGLFAVVRCEICGGVREIGGSSKHDKCDAERRAGGDHCLDGR
jgi:hypothetical protein